MECFLAILFVVVIFAIFICLENSGYLRKNNKPQIFEGNENENWKSMCWPPPEESRITPPEGTELTPYSYLVKQCHIKSIDERFTEASEADKKIFCESLEGDETEKCLFIPQPNREKEYAKAHRY